MTKRLGARLGWHTSFELVAGNPYLADFHADMGQWSSVGQVDGGGNSTFLLSIRRK